MPTLWVRLSSGPVGAAGRVLAKHSDLEEQNYDRSCMGDILETLYCVPGAYQLLPGFLYHLILARF
jgi:hypothetical protein